MTKKEELSKQELLNKVENYEKRIKELEQREADLVESERIYRDLITASPIGIFRTTPEGRILIANQALIEMMGYDTFEELSVRNVQETGYANDEYRQKFKFLMEKNGFVTGFESAWRRKDGAIMYIREYAHAVKDEHGKIISYEGTIENITEKKKIEEVLRESISKLVQTFDEVVESLAATVEKRDPYTAGHQKRVAILACAISAEMGFSEDFIKIIRTASILHDIGKLYVPAEILARPGKLMEAEMSLIKTHSEAGYDILKNISFDQPIAEIVYQHHEKLDGSGYPRGLTNKQIKIEAKIIAVADIMEALSSHRPYRPAFTIDQALTEIERLKDTGVLFASAVNACISIFRNKNFRLD